jgi:hypothetical protein
MKYLVVFIAIISLIPGCSYYDIVKKDKAEYLEGPKEKISKIVFESGEYIQFDINGGNYYNLNNCVAGMTQEKDFTIIPINKISKVQSKWGDLALDENLFADTVVIRQVSLKDNKLYTFRKWTGGGRCYKDSKIIIAGFDTSSKFYQIETDRIAYLDIYKFNSTKSYFADLSLVGLGAVVVGIVIYAIHGETKMHERLVF